MLNNLIQLNFGLGAESLKMKPEGQFISRSVSRVWTVWQSDNLARFRAIFGDFWSKVEMSVCLSVCPSVCLFTFEVPFKRLFAPTPRSQMSNIVRDPESLGKVMERSGLRFEIFCSKIVRNCRAKKRVFWRFCLTKHSGNHASRWIRDFWSQDVSLILA